jgi:hypothetical protein
MKDLEIYKRLGNSDDQFATEITNDESALPGLRAIAFYVLRDYGSCRTLFDEHSASPHQPPEDIFWQEMMVLLGNLDGKDPEEIRKISESIVSRAEWSIFARTFLGSKLETEKEFAKAIDLYQVVLSICPSNVVALAGLVRSYLQSNNSDKARPILKTIKEKKMLDGLNRTKKSYWRYLFFNYELATNRSVIAIITALIAFVLGFFPPAVWVVPALAIGFCLLFPLYIRKKYGIDLALLTRLAIIILFSCLIGYGTRSLFVYLEHL